MSKSKGSDSLVIIPTYNEKENIANIIEAVFALEYDFDILVIDDNSPDGTAQIVKDKQQSHAGRLHLLQRPGKQGLGTAYIAGFKWALDAGRPYPPARCLRLRRCRRGYRLALHIGRERGQLANGTGDDVILCECLRKTRNGDARARHHGRICLLQSPRA